MTSSGQTELREGAQQWRHVVKGAEPRVEASRSTGPAATAPGGPALPGRTWGGQRQRILSCADLPHRAVSPSWAVPPPGLTAGHVAVALADVTALEPAGPARGFGDTGGDLDAAADEGGSQVSLAAARRGALAGDVPLADLDAAPQADPCRGRAHHGVLTWSSPRQGGLGDALEDPPVAPGYSRRQEGRGVHRPSDWQALAGSPSSRKPGRQL